MFSWFKRRQKLPETSEEEVVYGFEATNIDNLVESLSSILGVHLYSHLSPMTGPWYSSHDLNSIVKALREDGNDAAKEVAEKIEAEGIPKIEIVLNDPDPYRGGPEIPNGGDYILKVTAGPHRVREIEKRLRNSDLAFKKLR